MRDFVPFLELFNMRDVLQEVASGMPSGRSKEHYFWLSTGIFGHLSLFQI